jgi:hypothetical protein
MRNKESDLAARFGTKSGNFAEATDEQRVAVVKKLMAFTGHSGRVTKDNFTEMAQRSVADFVANGLISETIRTMGYALKYLDKFKIDYGKDTIPTYVKKQLRL